MISEETKEKWKTKIKTIIEANEANQIQLNDWEIDFIENIHNQNKDLSWKQSKALNRIYTKVG